MTPRAGASSSWASAAIGLCGSISIAPPESTGYKPLADGDFVLAAEDDGHSGNDIGWSGNAQQRVDFAYLSYHDVAEVSKGLARKFYGTAPRRRSRPSSTQSCTSTPTRPTTPGRATPGRRSWTSRKRPSCSTRR